MGHNSPEHFMSLMGTILSNCVFTEVYITNGPEACAQQIQHSEAQVIVCDTMRRYHEKIAPVKNLFPWVKAVIIYGEKTHVQKGKQKKNTQEGALRVINWQ